SYLVAHRLKAVSKAPRRIVLSRGHEQADVLES
ncbi:MAG: hypothetical protein ACJAQ3_002959, partial [Planctomycetota bacterium]